MKSAPRNPLVLVRSDVIFVAVAATVHAISLNGLPKVMYWRTFIVCMAVSLLVYAVTQWKKPGMQWFHAIGRAWLLIPILLMTMGEETLLNPRTGFTTRTDQLGMSYVLALLGFIMVGAGYAKYCGED